MLGTQMIDTSRGPQIVCEAGAGGVSAYQVVMLIDDLIYPADGENSTHAGHVVGMTLAAIAAGQSGKVQVSGEVRNRDWSLVPGQAYFVALAGTISSTPPAIGFQQKIGIAKNSTTLILSICEAIVVI